MKLILTEAVENLGVAGDIVEVKPGYGRNFLLPRGLAIVANRGSIRQAERERAARQAKVVRDRDHARELKDQLAALEGVTLTVKTSQKGKLFGSIMPGAVVAAIAEAGGPKLDESMVSIAKGQIKTTGTHEVLIQLASDIEAAVKCEVVSANASAGE